MIQELTDRGPSRTYPVYYLEDAMNNLGDCFDSVSYTHLTLPTTPYV